MLDPRGMHRYAWVALACGFAMSCSSGGDNCPDCADGAPPDAAAGSPCHSAGVAVCTRAATCSDGGLTLLWSDAGAYDNESFGSGSIGPVGGCEFFYVQGCSLFPDSGTFDAAACTAIAPSLACGDGGLVIPDECHEPGH